MLTRSFWKGRRVLLTGHTGFKGSWLSLWLESLEAEVTGYALDPPTEPCLFEQAQVASGLRSVHGDVRDFVRLKGVMADCRPEVVLHLAAQSVVRRGYDDPVETYSSNVIGTVNLLEAIRQIGEPCTVVNVTSDKCYENREWVWGYREDDPLGGHDPYSNSKACAELVTSAFRDSYFRPEDFAGHGIAIASARAGNVIGGGDWTKDQLIPDLMRAFATKEPCLIRNPAAIRPWQFVLEPLRGYLMLAERLAEDPVLASAWNFGPPDEEAKPVSWIADELVRLWGRDASWRLDGRAHVREARYLKLDATKAKAHIHWRPMLPLDRALDWTTEWYRALSCGGDVGRLTRAQIERYDRLVSEPRTSPPASNH